MKLLALILSLAAAICACALPHMLSNDSAPVVATAAIKKGYTQTFDSYTNGTLVGQPGWTVKNGSFLVSGGLLTSDNAAVVNVASYVPPGFTVAPNHEVEAAVTQALAIADAWQGVTCAEQADGSCYFAVMDPSGWIYFAPWTLAGGYGPILTFRNGTTINPNSKIRLSVTGTGTGRRATCAFFDGAVWATPAGWDSHDFGVGYYFDGGTVGIVGVTNAHATVIDFLTIRNLP